MGFFQVLAKLVFSVLDEWSCGAARETFGTNEYISRLPNVHMTMPAFFGVRLVIARPCCTLVRSNILSLAALKLVTLCLGSFFQVFFQSHRCIWIRTFSVVLRRARSWSWKRRSTGSITQLLEHQCTAKLKIKFSALCKVGNASP